MRGIFEQNSYICKVVKIGLTMKLRLGHIAGVAVVLTTVAISLVSCGQGRSKKKTAESVQTRPFPTVQVPSMLGSNDEISEYLAEHYFDKFTAANAETGKEAKERTEYLCDSLHIAGVSNGEFEQAFANYCAILDRVPLETARKGMARLFDRIASCEAADTTSNIFDRTVEVVDRYLYDPNSPLRNEDYYCPFVEKKSQYAGYKDYERERFARTAQMCSLNRVGTKAADFVFADRYGRRYRLSSIKADRIILFFSNPGCHACAEIIETMKSYAQMEAMIASGELAVLNIYIDEDRANWYEYMPIYPESWYNGYDPDYVIRTDLLYDVRAIPSLYLLDKDKTVLMKDAPMEKVFAAVFDN